MRVPQTARTIAPPADWGRGNGYGVVPPDADATGPALVAEPNGAELYWPMTPAYTWALPDVPEADDGPDGDLEPFADEDFPPDPDGSGFPAGLNGVRDDPWDGPRSAPTPGPSQVAPPAPAYRDEDIDWYPVPPEYQGCVRLGTVHSDEQCPLVVLRFANEGGGWLHIEGSVKGLMNAFAFLFGRLSRIACMAEHYHGPQPRQGPLGRTALGD